MGLHQLLFLILLRLEPRACHLIHSTTKHSKRIRLLRCATNERAYGKKNYHIC